MLFHSRLASAVLFTIGAIGAANAAQQCFVAGTNAPTVYGAVTVTTSTTAGVCNDITGDVGPFAAGTAQLLGGRNNCTFTFDKPLRTSSVSVQVFRLRNNLNPVTVRLDGDIYQVGQSDLGPPLQTEPVLAQLEVLGTGYSAPTTGLASGTFTPKTNAPATISSISIAHSGQPSYIKVCADDGAPAAVPTMSEWNLLLTSGLLAGLGLFAFLRKKRHT